MANEKLIETLKTAIKNEEKSIKLYSNAADNTKNPIVKKTMIFLANWETQHAEKIKKVLAHQIDEKKQVDIYTEINEDPKAIASDFFGQNIDLFKQKIKGDESDLKVYDMGMHIEKEGHDFYKKAAKIAAEQDVKDFLEWLAKEENTHFEFLQEQHYYLSDPASWYLDEEKWSFEG